MQVWHHGGTLRNLQQPSRAESCELTWMLLAAVCIFPGKKTIHLESDSLYILRQ
jgi:hypothetical protein